MNEKSEGQPSNYERAIRFSTSLTNFKSEFLSGGDIDDDKRKKAQQAFVLLEQEFQYFNENNLKNVLTQAWDGVPSDEDKFNQIKAEYLDLYASPLPSEPEPEPEVVPEAEPTLEELELRELQEFLDNLNIVESEDLKTYKSAVKMAQEYIINSLREKTQQDILNDIEDPRKINTTDPNTNTIQEINLQSELEFIVNDVFLPFVELIKNGIQDEIPRIRTIRQFKNLILNPAQEMLERVNAKVREIDGGGEEGVGEIEETEEVEELDTLEKHELVVVKGIYKDLRENYLPKDESLALPEFEQLFELPSDQVWALLNRAILAKFNKRYIFEGTGGGTVFSFTEPGDLWQNEHLFSVAYHEAGDTITLETFIQKFPWYKLVKDENGNLKNLSDHEKNSLANNMWNIWRHRVMAIQNANNSATKLKDRWQGQEHTTFQENLINYISEQGESGGAQEWDIGAYYQRVFTDENVVNILSGGKKTDKVEDLGWLISEYENFFWNRIRKKHAGLNLTDRPKLEKLEIDLTQLKFDDQGNPQTILAELKKIITSKFGEKKFQEDYEIIQLAWKKAIWGIVGEFDLIKWDTGGVHTKAGRWNVRDYQIKVLANLSNVSWRKSLSLSLKRTFLTMGSFYKINLNLTTVNETGDLVPIYNEITDDLFQGMEAKGEQYTNWLNELVEESIDNYTHITSIEDVNWLKRNKNQLIREFKDDKEYIEGLIIKLDEVMSGAGPINPADLNLLLKQTARNYAILSRYRILEIKPEYTGLGASDGLPLAIPKGKIKKKDGVETAYHVPFDSMRDSMVNAALFVDFKGMDDLPKSAWAGFHIELYKWWKMLDLQNPKAILAPIKELRSKASGVEPVFLRFDNTMYELLKLRILAKNFLGSDVENLANQLDELLSGVSGEVKVYVDKITEEELKRSSGGDGQGVPGAGIVDLWQYAINYLFKKKTDPEFLLKIFRSRRADLSITKQEAEKYAKENQFTDGEKLAYFKAKFTTPVNIDVRRVVDDLNKANSLTDKNEKDQLQTRAKGEFMIAMLFQALVAYLEQYKVDDEVEANLLIPINEKKRKERANRIKTLGGLDPMTYVDREIFFAYVNKGVEAILKDLNIHENDQNKKPRNAQFILSDLLEVMKEFGIIGSKSQIMVDMAEYDTEHQKLVAQTKTEK
jgi:hypothetical protein